MSSLTEAFLQILQHFPISQTVFLPGLTTQEIEQISSSLLFNLPNEVLEIYRLHNGQKSALYYPGDIYTPTKNADEDLCIFDGKQLLPLQNAANRDLRGFNPNWLTLFSGEEYEKYLVLDVSNGYLLDFDVNYGDEDRAYIVYSSLTNMMRTHAEFYESGGDSSEVESFSESYQQIWLKYNADIGEQAINTVLDDRDKTW